MADSLALKYQSTIALPPPYGNENEKPLKVKNLKLVRDKGQVFLTWDKNIEGEKASATDPVRYVVYQFFPEEPVDIEDAEAIIALTPYNTVLVEDVSEGPSAEGSTFIVTALDRLNRESEPISVKWK